MQSTYIRYNGVKLSNIMLGSRDSDAISEIIRVIIAYCTVIDSMLRFLTADVYTLATQCLWNEKDGINERI